MLTFSVTITIKFTIWIQNEKQRLLNYLKQWWVRSSSCYKIPLKSSFHYYPKDQIRLKNQHPTKLVPNQRRWVIVSFISNSVLKQILPIVLISDYWILFNWRISEKCKPSCFFSCYHSQLLIWVSKEYFEFCNRSWAPL